MNDSRSVSGTSITFAFYVNLFSVALLKRVTVRNAFAVYHPS